MEVLLGRGEWEERGRLLSQRGGQGVREFGWVDVCVGFAGFLFVYLWPCLREGRCGGSDLAERRRVKKEPVRRGGAMVMQIAIGFFHSWDVLDIIKREFHRPGIPGKPPNHSKGNRK